MPYPLGKCRARGPIAGSRAVSSHQPSSAITKRNPGDQMLSDLRRQLTGLTGCPGLGPGPGQHS